MYLQAHQVRTTTPIGTTSASATTETSESEPGCFDFEKGTMLSAIVIIAIFGTLIILGIFLKCCVLLKEDKMRRAAAASENQWPDSEPSMSRISTASHTNPWAASSDRLSMREQLAASGPTEEVTPYSPSWILPASLIQPPSAVTRQDGRHSSVVLGGASRPSTPPPTYDQRIHDDLYLHHDDHPPEVAFEDAPDYYSRRPSKQTWEAPDEYQNEEDVAGRALR